MIKRITISFLIALAAAAAISSACPSPLDRFVADGEFCAYMVSPPEGVADVFLARYQAAVQSVTRQERPSKTRVPVSATWPPLVA